MEKGKGGPDRGSSVCTGRGGIRVLESFAAGHDHLLWVRVANRLVNEAGWVARVHLQLSDDYCSVKGHEDVALRVPDERFRLCPEDIGETGTHTLHSNSQSQGTSPQGEIPLALDICAEAGTWAQVFSHLGRCSFS